MGTSSGDGMGNDREEAGFATDGDRSPVRTTPSAEGGWDGPLPEAICHLPELGLSCFGCCGYDWKSIEEIRRQVSYNTWRFRHTYTDKEVFATTTYGVTRAGVCRGVMHLEDGSIGCPLHPEQNDGRDLRRGDCIQDYECNTLKRYREWSDEVKRSFLGFLAGRGYDPFEYSMANARGSLLASFRRTGEAKKGRVLPGGRSRIKDLIFG